MGPSDNKAVKRQREQMQNIPRMKSISSSSLPMPIDYGDLANAAGADVVMRANARYNYHSGGRTGGRASLRRRDSRTRTNEWRCALGRKGGREGGAQAQAQWENFPHRQGLSLFFVCAPSSLFSSSPRSGGILSLGAEIRRGADAGANVREAKSGTVNIFSS